MTNEEKIFGLLEKIDQRQTRTEGLLEQHSEMLEEMRADISGIKVRLDVEINQQLNLLAENQKIMLDKLAPKSELEELHSEVSVLKLAIRSINQEIAELKKAQ